MVSTLALGRWYWSIQGAWHKNGGFILQLFLNAIILNEEYQLVWSWNKATHILIEKLEYEVLSVSNEEGGGKWWWSVFLKWESPLKAWNFV